MYIYVADESNVAGAGSVYFDDMYVKHVKATMALQVSQATDYYPFGLTFNSYTKENTLPNNTKLFQGQEHIDDLGLNWDSFKWRNHQPDIGRFFNVDPLSTKYPYNSPYAFSENRVIDGRELEGLEWQSVKQKDGTIQRTLTIQLTNNSSLNQKQVSSLVAKMQANFAKSFSGTGGTANLVVQMNKTGPMAVTLVDKTSTPVLDKAGTVVGKTYAGGVTAKLGQTQKNSFEVTVNVDGVARSESDASRSFNHEAGHTAGLNHPWEPGNPSDIQQGGAGVNASTVKSNLMNSDANPDASNKSHTGTDLTSGQLSKIDTTITGQQPK